MFRPTVSSKLIIIGLIVSGCSFSIFASDVAEVLPLTKSIIIVHFDDGYIEYHNAGQDRSADIQHVDSLITETAENISTYTISSSDDPAYATAKAPTAVNRKSKGTEWAISYPFSRTKNHVKEHWLYLTLPTPMVSGKTYAVNTGTLAKNGSTWNLKFDEATARSEALHVNIVGYSTLAPEKYGYLYHWAGDMGPVDLAAWEGQKFQIVNKATGAAAFEGTIKFRAGKTYQDFGYAKMSANQSLTYCDIYDCNFSTFNTPGEYVLKVDGIGCSFPFVIAEDVFRKPFYYVMKGIFTNRAGCAIDTNCSDFPRPADHHPTLTPGFSGHIKYSSTRYCDISDENGDISQWEANMKGVINTWGWYHDAGDWDAYPRHHTIPTMLLFTFDLFRDNFKDDELDIPESGNGIPDILDEAAWLLRYYQRTRQEVKNKGYGTGGVCGARTFPDLWPNAFGKAPPTLGSWQDTYDQWVVSGEDPFMSYQYSGMAAHLACILQELGQADPQGIDWGTEAAETYAWAQTNTLATDTGEIHGLNLIGCRMYAAATLYRLTGDEKYHTQFKSDLAALNPVTLVDKGSIRYGIWLYANMPAARTATPATSTQCYNLVKLSADYIMLEPRVFGRGCRWSGNWWMPLLGGQATTPLIVDGIIGYATLKKKDAATVANYLSRMYTTSDYFLGTNPLNMAWVSGLGPRNPTQFMLLDGWYNGKSNLNIGYVPYGPRDPNTDFNTWPGYTQMDAYYTIYPTTAMAWPAHERWFDSRYHVSTGEFTIDVTNLNAAVCYGALCSKTSASKMNSSKNFAN